MQAVNHINVIQHCLERSAVFANSFGIFCFECQPQTRNAVTDSIVWLHSQALLSPSYQRIGVVRGFYQSERCFV